MESLDDAEIAMESAFPLDYPQRLAILQMGEKQLYHWNPNDILDDDFSFTSFGGAKRARRRL
jgi:hypothetical protein